MHLKKTNKPQSIAVIVIVAVIIISGVIVGAWYLLGRDSGNNTENPQSVDTQGTVNYDPATDDQLSIPRATTDDSENGFVEGKTPEQYSGQTNGNANCADTNCDNFKLDEENLLPEDR
jgi:hypothetical protein